MPVTSVAISLAEFSPHMTLSFIFQKFDHLLVASKCLFFGFSNSKTVNVLGCHTGGTEKMDNLPF
ncbi:hypothetical protein HanIR_Chr03g0133101 [Helianthus annuus]|nr:hypothetical protein HanIR_Chr03g0133101 [Helianthus annuus]